MAYAKGSTGCGKKQIEAKRNAGSEHLTKIERSLLVQKAMNQTTMVTLFTRTKKEHTE